MSLNEILPQKTILIFDLDGTIVDLKVDWDKLKGILNERFSKIYEDSCGFESISACLSYVVSKNDKEELLNFIDIIREFELKKIEEIKVISETVYFINNLDEFGVPKNVKLAILSLNTRDVIKKSLKKANILNKFEILVGREDVRRWKPEPEGLIKIQRYFNANPQEMIYFGDLKKDVITGQNAGISAFLIDEIIDLVRQKKS
ncbi:MAG: hypothetical protein EU548_08820 [Promethearchaeota archaeon]|nr:MAG: hypothetical protein EU548_08820 [Candidatus Lokiarchaeota archaeon]